MKSDNLTPLTPPIMARLQSAQLRNAKDYRKYNPSEDRLATLTQVEHRAPREIVTAHSLMGISELAGKE